MEYFDIYDKNRRLIGKRVKRGEDSLLPPGEYHLVADVILVNSTGEFLIQKRCADKRYCPNMWGLTGGAVSAGETSIQAIIRETKEEIGLDLRAEDLTLFYQSYGEDMAVLVDVWSACKDVDVADLIMQKEEVCALKWASADELRKLFAEKQFMPPLVSFLEKYLAEKSS